MYLPDRNNTFTAYTRPDWASGDQHWRTYRTVQQQLYAEQLLQVHLTCQMYKEAVKLYPITGHEGIKQSSSLNLSWNVRGITSVVGSANGINIGRFSCHIVISSSFKSVYFSILSVMVLWRLWLLGIVASTECASLTVWSVGLWFWVLR